MARVALLPLLLATGCSFLAVTAPPDRRPASGELHCTQSNGAPNFDLAVVALGAIAALSGMIYLGTTEHSQGDVMGLPGPHADLAYEGIFIGLPVMLLWGLSANHGYDRTARCRALTR